MGPIEDGPFENSNSLQTLKHFVEQFKNAVMEKKKEKKKVRRWQKLDVPLPQPFLPASH